MRTHANTANEIAVFIRGVRMCSRISITFELFALCYPNSNNHL